MQINAAQLAQILNGTVEGNPEVTVNRPSKIEEGEAGTISFLGNLKYEHYAYTTASSILLVSKNFVPSATINATLIRVDDVYASVAVLLEKFGQKTDNQGIVSSKSFVHTSVKIGKNVSIGDTSIIEENVTIGDDTVIFPQVFIAKNVKIGANVTIYPGVKIYYDCMIGDNCIIHANAVIGSDGFGFAPVGDGTFKKVPQIGNVLIENDVEIGANTTIDRATMGSTIIRKGVKLDNLIQIAHNVEIGENTVIAAQTGIAGSTKIGANCMIGGQVGIVGHIKIANRVRIQGQSGIAASIEEAGTAWYGSPAIPYSNYLKSYAGFKQLPDILKKIFKLEKEMNKTTLILTFLSLFFAACNKSEDNLTPSKCIAEKVTVFKTESKLEGFSGITQYEYDGEAYFYFDYGMAADWPAYLLDNSCDTICQYGFKIPPTNCKINDFFNKAIETGKLGD